MATASFGQKRTLLIGAMGVVSSFLFTVISFLIILNSPVLPDFLDGIQERGRGERILLDGCDNEVKNHSSSSTGGSNTSVNRYCSEQHRAAVEYCTRPGTNSVPKGFNLNRAQQSLPDVRQYSVLPMPSPPDEVYLRQCESVEEYLSSIKLGHRRWESPSKASNELTPSRFMPGHCFVPTLPPSPNETCGILDRYEHVIFHGDSFMRHVRQSIWMAMRGDLTGGGMPAAPPGARGACHCDGQFSENKACRTFLEGSGYFDQTQAVAVAPDGVCVTTSFVLGKRMNGPYLKRKGKVDPGESVDWTDVRCAEASYRGMLLVVSGGLHWWLNATLTFNELLLPILVHPKFAECVDYGKIRMLWIGMHAQSRILDGVYSQQRREKALEFNVQMQSLLDDFGVAKETVLVVDWWNMTRDAPTSDGVHSLSDVNLAKGAQILYLVRRWPGTGN